MCLLTLKTVIVDQQNSHSLTSCRLKVTKLIPRVLIKYCILLTYTSRRISIINHTLPSTIRAVIGTLTCMSMASNSTSDSYILGHMSTTVAALIVQGLKWEKWEKCIVTVITILLW